MYRVTFHEGWSRHFDKIEEETKGRTAKKIQKIIGHPQKRHLKKGAKFFVDEIGQYRIVYMVFEVNKEIRFFFIGNHKEYERWYGQYF